MKAPIGSAAAYGFFVFTGSLLLLAIDILLSDIGWSTVWGCVFMFLSGVMVAVESQENGTLASAAKVLASVIALIVALAFAYWSGYNSGRDSANKRVAEIAESRISRYRMNLQTRGVDIKDLEKYGWDEAETMYRHRNIGMMKAYGKILDEVRKK